jgi:hypothetical protein
LSVHLPRSLVPQLPGASNLLEIVPLLHELTNPPMTSAHEDVKAGVGDAILS